DAACSARSSYSLYASSTSSRTRFCALASTIGRSSAKLRRSPLTAYWRAGNVTLRPPAPPRLSHTLNPSSFKPSSTPLVKCSSASASLPGGFPRSLGVILTMMVLVIHEPPEKLAERASGGRDGVCRARHACTSLGMGAWRRAHSHCCSVLTLTSRGSAVAHSA